MNYLRPILTNLSSSDITTVDKPKDLPPVDPFDGFDQYAEADWDGAGARPITAETLAAARRVYTFIEPHLRKLKAPNLAPGADGTIGFEWYHQGGRIKKLFIEVQADDNVRAYWVRSSGKIEKNDAKKLKFAIYSIEPILMEMAEGT
jgi:hypothetical protein